MRRLALFDFRKHYKLEVTSSPKHKYIAAVLMCHNMPDKAIVQEKTDQALRVMREQELDLWLTYTRESYEDRFYEPNFKLLLGADRNVTEPGMILLTNSGRKIAIIFQGSVQSVRELEVYDEVYKYKKSPWPKFLEVLEDIDPSSIGLNYSRGVHRTVDGLTHGHYLELRDKLAGTPYRDRLVSAAPVIRRVRGQKTEIEIDRISRGAELTEALLDKFETAWSPEWTTVDVYEWVETYNESLGEDKEAMLWSCIPGSKYDPEKRWATGGRGEKTLNPGEIYHLDLAVAYKGYHPDLKRIYYRPRSRDDREPPTDLVDAYNDAKDAIDNAFNRLKPGVRGHEVDSAARETLVNRGWPEHEHSTGHQIGISPHDGGTRLAPRWGRYGDLPNGTVRENETYVLELGFHTEYGYLGREEDIVVREDGPEYLVEPQKEIRVLPEYR